MNQVHAGDRGCRETLNDIPPKLRVISRINSNNLAQTLTLLRGTITFQNVRNLYLWCGTGSLRHYIITPSLPKNACVCSAQLPIQEHLIKGCLSDTTAIGEIIN